MGNGAPDIFSAIAAVGSAKDGDVGLAFGALFGAGVFVTTVVAGTICLIQPFRSIQRPLLRDIIFFIVASFAAYVTMYDGKIELVESAGFIVMYVVYLIVLVSGYLINRRMKERRALIQATETAAAATTYGSIQTPREAKDTPEEEIPIVPDERFSQTEDSYSQPDVAYALYLRHAFLPRDDEPWQEKGRIGKIYYVLKVRYSCEEAMIFEEKYFSRSFQSASFCIIRFLWLIMINQKIIGINFLIPFIYFLLHWSCLF